MTDVREVARGIARAVIREWRQHGGPVSWEQWDTIEADFAERLAIARSSGIAEGREMAAKVADEVVEDKCREAKKNPPWEWAEHALLGAARFTAEAIGKRIRSLPAPEAPAQVDVCEKRRTPGPKLFTATPLKENGELLRMYPVKPEAPAQGEG